MSGKEEDLQERNDIDYWIDYWNDWADNFIGQEIMEELRWMNEANCVSVDVEQFFPTDMNTMYENKPYLKRICDNCDVLKECQEYSLRYAVQGWWGNTSEYQRKEKRRQLGIAPIQIVSEGVYE